MTPGTVDTTELEVIDFDEDGDLDVLLADAFGDRIRWAENSTGDGTVWLGRDLGSGVNRRGSAIADFDGDGDLDFVAGETDGGTVELFDNVRLHGVVEFGVEHEITTNFDDPGGAVPWDLDGDGDLDALVISENGDEGAWYDNTAGDGSAWSKHQIWIQVSPFDPDRGRKVNAGDVDGDGDLDVVASWFNSDNFTMYLNDGGSTPTFSAEGEIFTGNGAQYVSFADMDVDGDLDVVHTNRSGDDVKWGDNTSGDGSTWTVRNIDSSEDQAQALRLADIDADGDVDVVTQHLGGGLAHWQENLAGDGLSWVQHNVLTTDGAGQVGVGDMDGDGDLDILVSAGGLADEIVWMENLDGAGLFPDEAELDPADAYALRNIIDPGRGGSEVRVADVDRDGDQDVVVVGDNDIAWWENDGTGLVWTEHVDATFNNGSGVLLGDMNGDGGIDIFTCAKGQDDLSWFERSVMRSSGASADVSGSDLVETEPHAVLSATITHQGIGADPNLEFAELALLFEDGVTGPVDQADFEDTLNVIAVWADSDGDGSWSDTSDVMVQTYDPSFVILSTGVATLTLPDDDAALQTAAGATGRVFVVLTANADASLQALAQLDAPGSRHRDRELRGRHAARPDAAGRDRERRDRWDRQRRRRFRRRRRQLPRRQQPRPGRLRRRHGR